MKILNCKGKVLNLSTPVVMGILNVTPDSFYAASRFQQLSQITDIAGQMIEEGAQILDIGGMSSRPGASEISVQEEINRVQPVIETLSDTFPDIILSADTFRAEAAREFLLSGVHMINDISGGQREPEIYNMTASFNAAYIMMHMRGTPANMQQMTHYKDIMTETLSYFAQRLRIAKKAGLKDIIIDPGFGFAKDLPGNYQLLNHLKSFQIFDYPILAGISRKSMIQRVTGTDAEGALNGTTALHMAALERGANILRVHDIRAAVEVVNLHCQLHRTSV